jgi:2-polyprenyl-6-methoxyphenol hydroxylase-like FAD-dependent oxidoreductase
MTDVLIAGAGPTGLMLALWLTRLGVKVRIVDSAAEPGTTSRALAVQARTLELYRQLDPALADEVVSRGLKFAAVNLWVGGKSAARAVLGEMGVGLSPYPFVVTFPQDEHERLLIDRLAALGVTVERPTELVAFEQGDGVTARLRRPDGAEETVAARYLCGCDGARSRVRDVLGASFSGTTYEHLFYVADVTASGPVMNRELHVALDEADLLAVFPLAASGRARLIGVVRPGTQGQDQLRWEDVSPRPLERLAIQVQEVHWFSTYHVHHRVADHFRRGRAFLLGDAAHIHSPVGGQGMNTGLGDAINLAWKLAEVIHARAGQSLLDSYEPERIAFARRLVATTDQAFRLVTSSGPLARPVRTEVVPRLIPPLVHLPATRRLMFRTVAQLNVNYRKGPISAGRAGKVAGGDRLPWVPLDGGGDNFAPLGELRWQVQLYGAPPPGLPDACAARRLPLHVFPWQPAAERAGLARDAVYLVRPDGYVGLASREGRPAELEAYLDRLRE